jgi:acetyl esterase/lipase
LTAILSMKAALSSNLAAKPIIQLLICPVIDNSATTSTVWKSSQHAPWLTPPRMTWYREQYFRNPEDVKEWTASPCFAPQNLLAQSPKTCLLIAECDLLAPEALSYAKSLQKANVEVDVKVYRGATHSVLVLAG